MIIKRMTASLKRQDWTMVAIEFVLVVVGVVLGFQINDWGNRRAQLRARLDATQRLLDEAEQDVAYLRDAYNQQARWTGNLEYALGVLGSNRWQGADRKRLSDGLVTGGAAIPLSPPSATYDDLVSSGALTQIGDPRARADIARFRATLDFYEKIRALVNANLPPLEDSSALTFRLDPANPTFPGLDIDYPALAKDSELREKLALLATRQHGLMLIRLGATKDAERMCKSLATFAGRPCNLNLAPPSFEFH